MRATIISTGDELVHGRTVDTNASFLAGGVESCGLDVCRIVVLGDDGAALAQELERCKRDSDLVLVTGGLGPTADDRTRWAVADAAGVQLVLDEEARRHIEQRLKSFGRAVSDAQLTQAMFPAGSVVLPNPRGTARGFACRVGEAWVIAMPGVPGEMRPMFSESVVSFILDRLAPSACIRMETVHLFPVAESEVDERIRDLTVLGRNPSVGITVRDGVVSVAVRARGGDAAEAQGLLERDLAALRDRFGRTVYGYGDATLALVLGQELERRRLTIGLAESVTGGLVAHMLVEVPGISRSFLAGVVAYGNDAKQALLGVPAAQIEQHGAVSPQVAESMARGIRKAAGCDLGVSTTGIAGPTGGTDLKPVGLVYVGLALGQDAGVVKLNLWGDRERIRDRAAKHALHLARLSLTDGLGSLHTSGRP
jgi:nicotinamide-nucleotide amidase